MCVSCVRWVLLVLWSVWWLLTIGCWLATLIKAGFLYVAAYENENLESIEIRNKVSIGDESMQTTRTAKFLGLTIVLVQVYCTRIRTIVSYAAPAWFTMISNTSLNRLEGLQRLCLRVTYPEWRSYNERLTIAGITTLADHLASCCEKYIQKAALPTHRLSGRVSTKRECHRVTRQKHHVTYKTALRNKSFFVSMFL